jgi:hypothetical protein
MGESFDQVLSISNLRQGLFNGSVMIWTCRENAAGSIDRKQEDLLVHFKDS